MGKNKDGYDIKRAINVDHIKNVVCKEINKPNIDLFAQGFYDIYLK